MLNTGAATPEQVRGWVANRFYYQIAIPIKDAAVLSNCPDQAVRRGWVQRILDHDGFEIGGISDPGGIEAWLRLAEATGLSRAEVTDLRHVTPGVRFAVDAYVNFARRAPWQDAQRKQQAVAFLWALTKGSAFSITFNTSMNVAVSILEIVWSLNVLLLKCFSKKFVASSRFIYNRSPFQPEKPIMPVK